MLPAVWLLAHVAIVVWKVGHWSYLPASKWVAANILVPLHPYIVSLVSKVLPAFSTWVGNTLPTHENAPVFWYPVFMGIFGLLGAGIVALFKSRTEPVAKHNVLQYWIWWSIRRGVIFPIAWVVTHATVIVWKATSPGYHSASVWVADHILKTVHPYVVSFVSGVFPFFSTFMGNTEPTHEDAVRVFYPLIMTFWGLVGIGIWIGIARLWNGEAPPEVIAPTPVRRPVDPGRPPVGYVPPRPQPPILQPDTRSLRDRLNDASRKTT